MMIAVRTKITWLSGCWDSGCIQCIDGTAVSDSLGCRSATVAESDSESEALAHGAGGRDHDSAPHGLSRTDMMMATAQQLFNSAVVTQSDGNSSNQPSTSLGPTSCTDDHHDPSG
eukprot:936051-Rhodomonas_salina.4